MWNLCRFSNNKTITTGYSLVGSLLYLLIKYSCSETPDQSGLLTACHWHYWGNFFIWWHNQYLITAALHWGVCRPACWLHSLYITGPILSVHSHHANTEKQASAEQCFRFIPYTNLLFSKLRFTKKKCDIEDCERVLGEANGQYEVNQYCSRNLGCVALKRENVYMVYTGLNTPLVGEKQIVSGKKPYQSVRLHKQHRESEIVTSNFSTSSWADSVTAGKNICQKNKMLTICIIRKRKKKTTKAISGINICPQICTIMLKMLFGH